MSRLKRRVKVRFSLSASANFCLAEIDKYIRTLRYMLTRITRTWRMILHRLRLSRALISLESRRDHRRAELREELLARANL
jgi:hypothetical protein